MKLHLLNWNQVTKPKKNGGLGIRLSGRLVMQILHYWPSLKVI